MSFSQDIFSVSPVAEPRKVFLNPFDSRQDTENVLDCSPSTADLLLKSCFQYDFFFFLSLVTVVGHILLWGMLMYSVR